MKIYLFRLWVCLWVGTVFGSSAFAENRALLIGVGNYQAVASPLPGISKDLKMMYEICRKIGFEEHQIMLLRNRRAALSQIEATFEEWMIDGVRETDRVLVYFTGHGIRLYDQNGDETDGVDEALAPQDIRKTGTTIANALTDDRFGTLLAKIPAREIFVFIDACHSGSATRGGPFSTRFNKDTVVAVPKIFRYEGEPKGMGDAFVSEKQFPDARYAALSACDDVELAVATSAGSLFTRALYQSVMDAGTGDLNLRRLQVSAAKYIQENTPASQKSHTPQLSGNPSMMSRNIQIRPAPDSIWSKLIALVRRAPLRIAVSTNKTVFPVGDNSLKITCDIPKDGYINIFNLEPDTPAPVVLYPNRFHPENRVSAGDRVTIPGAGDKFRFRANPPPGESLIAAFFTQEPINAYKEGMGPMQDVFLQLSRQTITAYTEVQTRALFSIETAKTTTGTASSIQRVSAEKPSDIDPLSVGGGMVTIRVK